MDSEAFPSPGSPVQCCDCGCSCSLVAGSPGSWSRSVKRKHEEFEASNQVAIPGINNLSVARVQIENECIALREMVSNQQGALLDLSIELEEERNASASAANEAMSMILRLQREKAEIQMEARQFKRFVEEKMAHDQQELSALEDLLYKREQTIQALTCEVQAYKHRMMSFGLTESEAEGNRSPLGRNQRMMEFDAQYEIPMYDYPPLKCNVNENQGAMEDNVEADIEKYACGETPRDRLKDLEKRISQAERSPKFSQTQADGEFSSGKNILEKVVVGHSPRLAKSSSRFSLDSNLFIATGKEAGPDVSSKSPNLDSEDQQKLDNASDIGDNDRIYTIDSVHQGETYNEAEGGISDDYITTPSPGYVEDPEIKKLYMRLQALEADRESMRQAIISMRTEKAQLVLLKEIAQHLCKEMSPDRRIAVKKQSVGSSLPFVSIFKWVTSFIFWRKKARSKRMLGISGNGAGLSMLLDMGPQLRPWRCVTRTQV